MKQALDWLKDNDAKLVDNLAKLVAIPSISTDGEHQKEIDQVADLNCELMREAGLQKDSVLSTGSSNPFSYGEWMVATGKPSVFFYYHTVVQPAIFLETY